MVETDTVVVDDQNTPTREEVAASKLKLVLYLNPSTYYDFQRLRLQCNEEEGKMLNQSAFAEEYILIPYLEAAREQGMLPERGKVE
jgi:hypothetical protein